LLTSPQYTSLLTILESVHHVGSDEHITKVFGAEPRTVKAGVLVMDLLNVLGHVEMGMKMAETNN
jgi:hypothetical protein